MNECRSTNGTIAILGAGAYMAGPIAQFLHDVGGYEIVALVRPSTDGGNISPVVAQIHRGDLSNVDFVRNSTQGCKAIINLCNQLMPPRETIAEQMGNDLPIVDAGLKAALFHNAVFIHTSGNFSIPTAGLDDGDFGGVITNQLPNKPDERNDVYTRPESWSTFAHEGGLAAVATLAEAKHRQDWYVQDFITKNPTSLARVIIPAGIYGPGIGKKFSFWDLAAHLYLSGQFGDFCHAFVHIDDACTVYHHVLEHGKPGGRYPLYGETMTVRSFVESYATSCGVAMKADGPICTEAEARRVYDDSETRATFGIQYQHTFQGSIADAVKNLKERGLLMVQEK